MEDYMLKRLLMAAVALAFASGTAFASGCPGEMKKIDEALAKDPKLATDAVKKLRASGEAKHKAGDHAGSMKDLGEAKAAAKIK
jgi:outer membrane lipoprotein-sorting protein